MIDVDFSLALENRTGKYFIGCDILTQLPDLIADTYYGNFVAASVPEGDLAESLARLQHVQVVERAYGLEGAPAQRRRGTRPLLHLDAYTVATTELRRCDAVLCHDIGPVSHRHLFEPVVCKVYDYSYAEISRAGPHMIFVSEASMRAFKAYFPDARPASTRVIYPPLRLPATQAPPPGQRIVRQPYLLTVGSIGARKNQLGCIRAFARSGLAARGVRYVLCGASEPGHDAVALAAKDVPGVELMPYVTDEQLRVLYAGAAGFVLASLLEGFGMPVAEAIRWGLIPLVSQGGVMAEVAGPGALTVDPLNEEALALAMVTLMTMNEAERDHRRSLLGTSIERFTLGEFVRIWKDVILDMLDTRTGELFPHYGGSPAS